MGDLGYLFTGDGGSGGGVDIFQSFSHLLLYVGTVKDTICDYSLVLIWFIYPLLFSNIEIEKDQARQRFSQRLILDVN